MKKVLGYLFIAVGCFLSVSLLLFLGGEFLPTIGLVSEGTLFDSGIVLGELLYTVIMAGLIVLLFRTGAK